MSSCVSFTAFKKVKNPSWRPVINEVVIKNLYWVDVKRYCIFKK